MKKSNLRRSVGRLLPNSLSERQTKSGRPCNDAHLIYEILSEDVMSILESEWFIGLDLLEISPKESFLQDKETYNAQRAQVWFRIYALAIWWKLKILN